MQDNNAQTSTIKPDQSNQIDQRKECDIRNAVGFFKYPGYLLKMEITKNQKIQFDINSLNCLINALK